MLGFFFWLFVFLILYTYIGYPLLIWLFSRLIHEPTAYSSAKPYVTLLIAAFNEEKALERTAHITFDRTFLRLRARLADL